MVVAAQARAALRRFDHNLWQIVNTTTAEAIRKSQKHSTGSA